MSFLSILITILLNSISDSLLASVSFSSLSGESSISFYCTFFFCLPILGDSFCLFLWFPMLCFASFFIGWTSVIGVLLDSDLLVWMFWGYFFFHLCGFSCCTWALPVGGSFVGGFSLPACLLVLTMVILSGMLLYRCWLIKCYYQITKPMPAKRTPHHLSSLNCNRTKIDKCEEGLHILYDVTKGMWDERKRGKCYCVEKGRRIDKIWDRTETKKGIEQNLQCK